MVLQSRSLLQRHVVFQCFINITKMKLRDLLAPLYLPQRPNSGLMVKLCHQFNIIMHWKKYKFFTKRKIFWSIRVRSNKSRCKIQKSLRSYLRSCQSKFCINRVIGVHVSLNTLLSQENWIGKLDYQFSYPPPSIRILNFDLSNLPYYANYDIHRQIEIEGITVTVELTLIILVKCSHCPVDGRK